MGTKLTPDDSPYTRISIVMPSFNQAAFIERSILSVLNQDYPNLQFIIMDGGSTDGTVDVIRKYEKHLSWRSEPDQGQSDAINKALQLTDGELVGWLNSDDVYFPGALLRMHQLARKRPAAVLLSGTVALIDGNDRIVRISKFIRPTSLRLLYEGLVMSSQGVFWRREVQARTGLYDPTLHHAMDMDFWLRVLRHGRAEFVPQLVGGFRVHAGTKTSVAGYRGCSETRAIRKRYNVDDQTGIWRLIRTALRISRVLHWTLMTKRHCAGIGIRKCKPSLLWLTQLLLRALPATRCFKVKCRLLSLCGVAIQPSARLCSSVRIVSSGSLAIGADTFLGHEVLISGGSASIVIGNYCDIAPRVMILSGTHEITAAGPRTAGAGHSKPITIEDGVWIGAGSIILGGVRIGQHSVVGAGSVVVRDIPPYCVALGSPCRVTRHLSPSTQA